MRPAARQSGTSTKAERRDPCARDSPMRKPKLSRAFVAVDVGRPGKMLKPRKRTEVVIKYCSILGHFSQLNKNVKFRLLFALRGLF